MSQDNINAARAGHYIMQPEGFRAFHPRPLPPVPPLEMNDEIWSLLSQADRALGRLDGSTETIPNPDLFVFTYVRQEAVLSSQIEGTQASLMDVLEFEVDSAESDSPSDVGEVVNYIDAMNHGLKRLKKLPVSLRLIKEIHERLLRNVRGGERTPGRFRTSQNWIGPPGRELNQATFVPPPPHEVPVALGELERFLHDDSPMPILIKVALAHAQFETIHPFLDGNGRVGRLLITFLLCEREVLQRPLLYISHFFKRHRQEYYDRLQAVRDRGAWEGWVAFFLRGVFEVSQAAAATAREIVNLRERHRQLVLERFGATAGNALTLLESLYSRAVISVKLAAKTTGLSFSNANKLVAKFEELGLLHEKTGRRRNRRFDYREYLELFID